MGVGQSAASASAPARRPSRVPSPGAPRPEAPWILPVPRIAAVRTVPRREHATVRRSVRTPAEAVSTTAASSPSPRRHHRPSHPYLKDAPSSCALSLSCRPPWSPLERAPISRAFRHRPKHPTLPLTHQWAIAFACWQAERLTRRQHRPPRPPPPVLAVRPRRRLLRPNFGHHRTLGEHVVEPHQHPGRERRQSP
jgi:hypothetical protein